MRKEKSEFGKGLVICLVKFAEHFMCRTHWQYKKKLEQQIDFHKKFYDTYNKYDKPKDMKAYAISYMIKSWANGASDHLYEIECPKGKEWDYIRRKITKLKSKGLEIGHGFRDDKIYTQEDFAELWQLTKQIAMYLDKKIGLNPDEGQW